jgi:hypothetical protein
MTDTLTTATDIHARISAGITYLHTHYDDPVRYHKGRQRLKIIYTQQYLPALERLRTDLTASEITDSISAIEQRLNTGWERMGQHGTDKQYATFTKLLSQYEVLTNAGNGTTLNALLERLACLDVAINVPDYIQTSHQYI